MAYKARKGIVLLKICGVDVLASTREAWDECPSIRPIPRLWAGGWTLLQKGRTTDDVLKVFSDLFKDKAFIFSQKLEQAFEQLYKEGFLIPTEPNTTIKE